MKILPKIHAVDVNMVYFDHVICTFTLSLKHLVHKREEGAWVVKIHGMSLYLIF
jgi:hypothetical protein